MPFSDYNVEKLTKIFRKLGAKDISPEEECSIILNYMEKIYNIEVVTWYNVTHMDDIETKQSLNGDLPVFYHKMGETCLNEVIKLCQNQY